MQRGREVLTHADEETYGVDYVADSIVAVKGIKAIDDPTNRDLRVRRDLIYMYLRKELGLTADEIAVSLKFAARSPRHVRRRISQASEYYGRAVGA